MRHATKNGAFEIDTLPGQSQVAICHSFFIADDARGHGHGHDLKMLQAGQLRIDQYDYAICTVSSNNAAQKSILRQAGWKPITHFQNRRRNEKTEIWGYHPWPAR